MFISLITTDGLPILVNTNQIVRIKPDMADPLRCYLELTSNPNKWLRVQLEPSKIRQAFKAFNLIMDT